MLQARELMIGDWVWYDNQPYQIRRLGIFGENRDGEDYPAVCVGKPTGIGLILERNEIEPIPLTPEILERMGFTVEEEPKYDDTYTKDEYTATMKCVDVRKCNVEIKYKTYRNDINIISHDYNNILQYRSIATQVMYVHELQHLFVLLGIEKEIAL